MEVIGPNDGGTLSWHFESSTGTCSFDEWLFAADVKQGSRALGMLTGVVGIPGLLQARINIRLDGIVSHLYRESLLLSFEASPSVEIVSYGGSWTIQYQESSSITLEVNRTDAILGQAFPHVHSSDELGKSLTIDRQFDLLDMKSLALNETSWRALAPLLEAN